VRAASATPAAPASRATKNNRRGIPVNPTLDNVITIVFILECIGCVWMMRDEPQYLLVLFGLLVVTAGAILFTKFVFRRLAVAIDVKGAMTGPRGQYNLKKFEDQSWQLVIHVSMTIFACSVIDWKWWTEHETIWQPCPRKQNPSPGLVIFFMTQLGIWIYTAVSHRFLEKRHKDYFEMYLHHVVTIALVASCVAFKFQPAGLLILLVHDSSDIVADLLKMSNYMKFDGPKFFFLTEVFFMSNLGSWLYLRLWRFPWLIHTCFITSQATCAPPDIRGKWWLGSRDEIPYQLVLIGLLFILLALHFYWFALFLRILYRLVSGSNAHDAGREEYEGDSGSEREPEH